MSENFLPDVKPDLGKSMTADEVRRFRAEKNGAAAPKPDADPKPTGDSDPENDLGIPTQLDPDKVFTGDTFDLDQEADDHANERQAGGKSTETLRQAEPIRPAKDPVENFLRQAFERSLTNEAYKPSGPDAVIADTYQKALKSAEEDKGTDPGRALKIKKSLESLYAQIGLEYSPNVIYEEGATEAQKKQALEQKVEEDLHDYSATYANRRTETVRLANAEVNKRQNEVIKLLDNGQTISRRDASRVADSLDNAQEVVDTAAFEAVKNLRGQEKENLVTVIVNSRTHKDGRLEIPPSNDEFARYKTKIEGELGENNGDPEIMDALVAANRVIDFMHDELKAAVESGDTVMIVAFTDQIHRWGLRKKAKEEEMKVMGWGQKIALNLGRARDRIPLIRRPKAEEKSILGKDWNVANKTSAEQTVKDIKTIVSKSEAKRLRQKAENTRNRVDVYRKDAKARHEAYQKYQKKKAELAEKSGWNPLNWITEKWSNKRKGQSEEEAYALINTLLIAGVNFKEDIELPSVDDLVKGAAVTKPEPTQQKVVKRNVSDRSEYLSVDEPIWLDRTRNSEERKRKMQEAKDAKASIPVEVFHLFDAEPEDLVESQPEVPQRAYTDNLTNQERAAQEVLGEELAQQEKRQRDQAEAKKIMESIRRRREIRSSGTDNLPFVKPEPLEDNGQQN